MKYFTLVGSKTTHPEVKAAGTRVAKVLLEAGWGGYSGNAVSMDDALNEAMLETKIFNGAIFLPWGKFGHRSLPDKCYDVFTELNDIGKQCLKTAESLIPWWSNMGQGGHKLHARNVKQVLGADLKTESSLVVHSARGNTANRPVGGTRTAVVLAQQHNINTFNIRFPAERAALIAHCKAKYDLDLTVALEALGDRVWPDIAKPRPKR